MKGFLQFRSGPWLVMAAMMLLIVGGCEDRPSTPAPQGEATPVGATPTELSPPEPVTPTTPPPSEIGPAGDGHAAIEGPHYTIMLPAATWTTGTAGQLELHVVPRQGLHINLEYPWRLTLSPTESIVLERVEWDRQAASTMTEGEAVYRIPATASEPGEYRVGGELRFSVCSDGGRCYTPRENVSWAVAVQ
jgi:hypothetical protein